MRELHYSGESVFVDTLICQAVFEYARALAGAGSTEIVKVPIWIRGQRDFSNLLLGPATVLFCTPGPEAEVDLTDDELLSYLAKQTAALGVHEVAPEKGVGPAHLIVYGTGGDF